MINLAVAAYLIKNQKLLEEAQKGDDRFVQTVGSNINIYIMLAIAIGQLFGYSYIMLFSVYPNSAEDSEIGKKIAEIKSKDVEKWNNELKKQPE